MLFPLFPYLFLILILCVVTITDLRDKRIPDTAIIAAILAKTGHTVIVWAFENPAGYQKVDNLALIEMLLQLFIDGLAISLPVLLLVLLIEKLWKKEAMGGGDIKLIFVAGMYLGWEKNLWMLLVACMIGVVVGIVKAKTVDSKEDYFSFGPMIAIATVFCMVI